MDAKDVKVPREPVEADETPALCFDVNGEPVFSWVIGMDPGRAIEAGWFGGVWWLRAA